MPDIISIVGHTALDYLFNVEKIAGPNESYPIINYEVSYGGGAANIVATIAILGGKCQLVSGVGDDFKSSGYEDYLNSIGVDLSRLYRMDDEKSTKAFVFTDQKHNQCTYFHWGPSARLKNIDPPSLDFVHLATSEPVFNSKVAQKSKFVSFDPGQDLVTYTPELLETILNNTNIMFANKHEVKRVCNMVNWSFEHLRDVIDIIIITYDAEGSKIYTDGIDYSIPAIPVNAVDPTGAGDGYRAGFLLAYTRGFSLEDCGKIGSTVASFIVEKAGCQTNLPNWDDVDRRCRKYYNLNISG
ncbi:MAG: carbohydrate kinase family protein [Methanohalobium sp.]|uniref:carbohydrate kinase family protein n=1 Tax=Methanohalobium sp. TaxID=2837493 RepID=UPI00397D9F28